MTFSTKLEMAIDMATATNDWTVAGKLIIWAFESGFIDADAAIIYRDALRRVVRMDHATTLNTFSGPQYRAHLAERPLVAWANKYKR